MMLLAAVLVSISAWLWVIYRADRFEREPLKTILYVGVVGGFVSSLVAGLGNSIVAELMGISADLDAGLPPDVAATFALFVGVNEELCKVVATVLLVRRLRQFDEPLDGVIYGMTVGLGFAGIEALGYMSEGGLGDVIGRSLTAVPLHIGLAALWGAGIARARFRGHDAWVRGVLPYYLIAAAIHAAYDFAILAWPGEAPVLLISIPCLVGTLIVAKRIVKGLVRKSPFRPATICPACDHENPAGARFCATCGASLAPAHAKGCKACGAVVPAVACFCPACGGRMAGAPGTKG